jgi:hypothetical protein
MKFKTVLKSKYCWFVILLSFLLGYFLIIRKITSFTSFWSILLSVFYIILFSISNSCLVYEIRNRVESKVKTGTSSILSILGSVLGLGAVQLCTVSGTCGMSLFASLILTLFPTSIGMIFIENGLLILFISNLLLLFSILKMGCFKKST